MEQQSFTLTFPDAPTSDAGKWAADLQRTLADIEGASVKRAAEGEGHMDFGATLVLLAGTGAALALAERIGDWLKLHRSASVTIESADGKIQMTNVSGKDAERLIHAFQKRPTS